MTDWLFAGALLLGLCVLAAALDAAGTGAARGARAGARAAWPWPVADERTRGPARADAGDEGPAAW